jgi:hypothetical protein
LPVLISLQLAYDWPLGIGLASAALIELVVENDVCIWYLLSVGAKQLDGVFILILLLQIEVHEVGCLVELNGDGFGAFEGVLLLALKQNVC